MSQLHCFQLRTTLNRKDFSFFSHGLCTEKQSQCSCDVIIERVYCNARQFIITRCKLPQRAPGLRELVFELSSKEYSFNTQKCKLLILAESIYWGPNKRNLRFIRFHRMAIVILYNCCRSERAWSERARQQSILYVYVLYICRWNLDRFGLFRPTTMQCFRAGRLFLPNKQA